MFNRNSDIYKIDPEPWVQEKLRKNFDNGIVCLATAIAQNGRTARRFFE